MVVRRTGPLVFVVIATLVLAACAPPAIPPMPTATWTYAPTLVPTSTSTPARVPTATGTPLPTATATPRPTWTPTTLPTVTQTPTAQPQIELPIGPLAFVSPEQQLLVREPAGAIRAIMEEGIARSPAWSPDGARLAFSYQADDRSPAEVRIYDPAEGTQTTVWTDPGDLAPMVLPFRKIAWSPSGGYLFLSQGCCFVGALYVLDLESKTLVGRHASGTEMWSPEADLLALSVRQPVEHLIPIETGDSSSIALVRPGQITPTVVLTGTEERLYLAKAWLGEGELLYEQLDLYDGGERTERNWGVAEIDSSPDGPPSVVASRPLEVLPVEYDYEAFTEHLSPWLPGVTFAERVWSADGSWVVFRAYGDEEAPDVNRIYAFQWEEGPLVGPLAEGTEPALAPAHTSALPAVPTLPGLTIETYALEGPPQVEPLTFVPVQGTQEEVLAKRQRERDKTFPHNSVIVDGQRGLSAQLGSEKLVASNLYTDVVTSQGGFQQVTVQVSRNGEPIYAIPAGDGGPIDSLRGLWAYSDHWVLEFAVVTLTISSENTVWSDSLGQIARDGELLNEREGYQEAFGFQLMNGKPFYFFKRDGQIGISYDDQEMVLGYSSVPHYACCSAAERNPRKARNMVAFFAQRDERWYYVEIGAYE